jgi:hypothetical protein
MAEKRIDFLSDFKKINKKPVQVKKKKPKDKKGSKGSKDR